MSEREAPGLQGTRGPEDKVTDAQAAAKQGQGWRVLTRLNIFHCQPILDHFL